MERESKENAKTEEIGKIETEKYLSALKQYYMFQ